MLDQLNELKGCFWTKLDELVKEIEELGLEVELAYEEYIEAVTEDEEIFTLYLHGAGNTIAITDIK